MASTTRTINFHVTCGYSKKLLCCTVTDLKERICEHFATSDDKYVLQLWDTNFADWVDVDELGTLETQDKWKLQVVVT